MLCSTTLFQGAVQLKEQFNIYHHFAGAFVPCWLLSRQEVGADAKLAYAMLAQQANSRGVTQLNFRMQTAALGEDEGRLAKHLMELEGVGLIQVSRGNVHTEDIRVLFPRHRWMVGLEPPVQEGKSSPPTSQHGGVSRSLFPEDAATGQTAQPPPSRPTTGETTQPEQREGRGRRRRRKPQSKHSFEVCLQFVTYQKEVLQRDSIWNVTGLARHLHLSGEQDVEIDTWLTEQASNAA